MKTSSDIRTRRWTRSPRGQILGVATGLAEWRGFPVEITQLIVFLAIVFTGFFPGALIYLLAAIILPLQSPDDVLSSSEWYRYESKRNVHRERAYEDATFTETSREKSTEDLKAEYENLKRKVEEMEGQIFDREKDWDSRFNSEEK